MTEILYFQGPLSTFLFHIPQKTYFFTHRFWWGTVKLYFRQQPLISNNRDGDKVAGKYWWYWGGRIYLNNDDDDWHKLDKFALADLIFHEVSHHFGTVDNDSKGSQINAHYLTDRLSKYQQGFRIEKSQPFRNMYPLDKIPELFKIKD